MQALLLFVPLVVLCSVTEGTTEPLYVVTVPAYLVHPTIEKACVILLHLKGGLHLKLELVREDSGNVELLVEDKIDSPSHYQCYNIQVPAPHQKFEIWKFRVSGTGENLKINDTRKVHIHKFEDARIVQTEKSLYKPGQNVKFQIVTLGKALEGLNETEYIDVEGSSHLDKRACESFVRVGYPIQLPLVQIKDPNNNVIAQWRDVAPVQGISDFSFHLAEELPPGDYKIVMPHHPLTIFSVAEYELKRFEVIINAPNKVSPKDESFPVEVCGRYMFGKPVQGSLRIIVCESSTDPTKDDNYSHDKITFHFDCLVLRAVLAGTRGCCKKEIDIRPLHLSKNTYIRHLTVSSSIKEGHTGFIEKAATQVDISEPEHIYFVDIEYFYHKGIPFSGMLAVLENEKHPKANETVYVIVKNDVEKSSIPLVTDQTGAARFTLDTSKWKDGVSLKGSFQSENGTDEDDGDHSFSVAYRWLFPFYSASNSFVKVDTIAKEWPCNSEQTVKVAYLIHHDDLHPDADELSIFYGFLFGGRTITNGRHRLDVKGQPRESNLQGSFSVNITLSSDLHHQVNLLVFTVLKNGAMTGDRASYRIPACYLNKVKLQFSKKVVEMGGKVTLNLTVESGSVCSVRSVDKGNVLLKPHKQVSPFYLSDDEVELQKIYFNFMSFGYIPDLQDREDATCLGKSTYSQPIYGDGWSLGNIAADAYSLFRMSSLKVLTNTKIHKPVSCSNSKFKVRSSGGKRSASHSLSYPTSQEFKKHKTHSRFPETWMYDRVNVGPEGHTQLSLITPDTVTSWVTDAFCLTKSGYRESGKVELTIFQPFFTDLKVPLSVIQKEKFQITAHVFNYMESCVLVKVSILETPEFTAVRKYKGRQCICAESSDVTTWDAIAKKIGKVVVKLSIEAMKLDGNCTHHTSKSGNKDIEDSLEKVILVKPSGVKKEMTETYRVCSADGSGSQEISLKVPDNLVDGFKQAQITIFGDIHSNAIANIGSIINLPTGCGEQNIANFAASLQLLYYLKRTDQLTSHLEQDLLKSLSIGYQKQLKFKHENGSYSIFSGDVGNTWLTALVVKSMIQARPFIFVEEKNIEDSVKWLSHFQLSDGCFQEQGQYYNNQVLDKDIKTAVTAYIILALMESDSEEARVLVEKALLCLREKADTVSDTYVEALLSYTFALSGDVELKQLMLDHLEKKAQYNGIFKHWKSQRIHNFNSGDVETNSYVALALLTQKPSARDIDEAAHILNWVIKKENPHGGFLSSQDTIVALQALSKFSEVSLTGKEDVSVSVRSLSGFQKEFFVDKHQGILLQKASLPDIPGEYVVTVTGGGCAYVQTHLQYNVPPKDDVTYFALNVTSRPMVCTSQELESFELIVEISYTGNRFSSNMVIVEVDLLSGFVPNKKSLTLPMLNEHVKRTEIQEERVVFYLNEVRHEKQHFSVIMSQETRVDSLQPAIILVYDYYVKGEHAVAEYNSPCDEE